MQRSLKYLTDNGYDCAIVEKYIKHPGMKFGRRIDVWGIGDLLACRGPKFEFCNLCFGIGRVKAHPRGRTFRPCKHCNGTGLFLVGDGMTALVQCCRDGDFAEHKEKILGILPKLQWSKEGNSVVLHGWGLKGPKGKKRWTLREETIVCPSRQS